MAVLGRLKWSRYGERTDGSAALLLECGILPLIEQPAAVAAMAVGDIGSQSRHLRLENEVGGPLGG
jgi:hypothetical protein